MSSISSRSKASDTSDMILGETYEEVLGLTEMILDHAAERGDANVVVILDQNLDYIAGKAKGTEIITELRQAGFRGHQSYCPDDCLLPGVEQELHVLSVFRFLKVGLLCLDFQ